MFAVAAMNFSSMLRQHIHKEAETMDVGEKAEILAALRRLG